MAVSQEPDDVMFSRIWVIGLSVLLLVTYPLWTPGNLVTADFPRVTWIRLPLSNALILAVESAAVIALAVSIVAVVVNRRWQRLWWSIGSLIAVLVLLDQQRLQPWAYQSMIYALILGGMPWREGKRWITALAISIYFYSAAGKFDFQFVHTVGNQMVQTLAQPIGGMTNESATGLAIALPAAELSSFNSAHLRGHA